MPRHLGISLAGVLVVVCGGCGARTALDVCAPLGATRSCENGCGAGTQTCTGTGWTTCVVPSAQRACSNTCGPGTEMCADGVWSDCAVPPAMRDCAAQCGVGQQICVDGGWGACDGPEAGPPTIQAKLWDFQPLVPPDFGGMQGQAAVGLDPGIVEPTLGADDTPAYAGDPTTPSTHGAADFAEWYHDSPVNLSTGITLPFGPSPTDANIYTSQNPSFFPVDNQLFGNETAIGARAATHNYYFTVAFALDFRYRGGETFRFASDDDSWVFINRQLAVNLGGVHAALSANVALDAVSDKLGITVGQTYRMNVFYADREPTQAILDVQVPAADFAACSDGGLP